MTLLESWSQALRHPLWPLPRTRLEHHLTFSFCSCCLEGEGMSLTTACQVACLSLPSTAFSSGFSWDFSNFSNCSSAPPASVFGPGLILPSTWLHPNSSFQKFFHDSQPPKSTPSFPYMNSSHLILGTWGHGGRHQDPTQPFLLPKSQPH